MIHADQAVDEGHDGLHSRRTAGQLKAALYNHSEATLRLYTTRIWIYPGTGIIQDRYTTAMFQDPYTMEQLIDWNYPAHCGSASRIY